MTTNPLYNTWDPCLAPCQPSLHPLPSSEVQSEVSGFSPILVEGFKIITMPTKKGLVGIEAGDRTGKKGPKAPTSSSNLIALTTLEAMADRLSLGCLPAAAAANTEFPGKAWTGQAISHLLVHFALFQPH